MIIEEFLVSISTQLTLSFDIDRLLIKRVNFINNFEISNGKFKSSYLTILLLWRVLEYLYNHLEIKGL